MSWFEKAKTVLIEALDIQDDDKTTTTGNINSAAVGGSGIGIGIGSASGTAATSSSGGKAMTPIKDLNDINSSTIGTPTFYDNPHANEMVTIPPRASDATVAVTAAATGQVAASSQVQTLNLKRQSVASDSVDLLSSPSPTCLNGAEVCLQNSESSLELITAPTTPSEIEISPDTEDPSLPDSIVIIASNETSDNPDGDADDDADDDDDDNVGDGSGDNEKIKLNIMDLEHSDHSLQLNDSTQTMKALAFSDVQSAATTTACVDSDSTQSFEDIQLQLSEKGGGSSGTAAVAGVSGKSLDMVDQSYSSTSSDIEIISNPNGDSSTNSTTTRTSPQKFKELLGKSHHQQQQQQQQQQQHAQGYAKAKGHQREPSEISLLSEDSQSELDKLINRISELNQVIEAREQRLLQSERQNADLIERNKELRVAFEAVTQNAQNNTDANEAVQRLSALEKKFQASIRERDALRIQIKSLKDELLNKIPRDELTECNEMITALQSEGEKLSKEILQQSNIIKKLRAKEKTSDTLLKRNGEQISQLSTELERLKKSLAAKEEMERTQIEAVCKMSAEKRRADEENAVCRSRLEDLQSKLAALQASFDGVKGDLQQRTRLEQHQQQSEQREFIQQMGELRERLRNTELAAAKREQQLRDENRQLLQRLETAELRAESCTQELSASTAPLIRQIESLQRTLNQRTASWSKDEQVLIQRLEDVQLQLSSLQQMGQAQEESHELLRQRCCQLEEKLSQSLTQVDGANKALRQQHLDGELQLSEYKMQLQQLRQELQQQQIKTAELQNKLQQAAAAEQQQQQQNQNKLTAEALRANNEMQLMMKSATSTTATTMTHSIRQTKSQSPPISLMADAAADADDDGGGSNEDNNIARSGSGIIDWHDDLDGMSSSGQQTTQQQQSMDIMMMHGVQLNLLAANTTSLEHLQSLLKQREGELNHLQWELSRQQAERSILDQQISDLAIELETIKEKLPSYETMEKSYEDLQHRYDALLQMYGEKVERTEELELDLVELKQAYKLQIDELLAQPPPNLCIPKSTTTTTTTSKPT